MAGRYQQIVSARELLTSSYVHEQGSQAEASYEFAPRYCLHARFICALIIKRGLS